MNTCFLKIYVCINTEAFFILCGKKIKLKANKNIQVVDIQPNSYKKSKIYSNLNIFFFNVLKVYNKCVIEYNLFQIVFEFERC